jgi:beta-glucanase (GH16 family)
MIRIKEFIFTVCFTSLLSTSVDAQSLDGWALQWSDEFNGTSLDGSKWQLELNEGDHGMSAYTSRSQNLYLSDGCLVIQAQKENHNGKPYTSSQISSRNRGHWKYGRFDIRAKLPYGQGMWPAIWMMPNNPAYGGWPRSGEIDIMENLGHDTRLLYSTLHHSSNNQMLHGTWTAPEGQSLSDTFHVYTMIWDTGSFSFYVDSIHNYYNCTSWSPANVAYPKPFDQSFFMMFDLAVGGSWGGPPDSSTVFPQKMLIDWIRVYKRQNVTEIKRQAEKHGPVNYALTISKKWIELDLKNGTLVSLNLYDFAGREVIRMTDGTRIDSRIRWSIPSTLTRGGYVWKLATGGGPIISGKTVIN